MPLRLLETTLELGSVDRGKHWNNPHPDCCGGRRRVAASYLETLPSEMNSWYPSIASWAQDCSSLFRVRLRQRGAAPTAAASSFGPLFA